MVGLPAGSINPMAAVCQVQQAREQKRAGVFISPLALAPWPELLTTRLKL
jgi:hypothetical protein